MAMGESRRRRDAEAAGASRERERQSHIDQSNNDMQTLYLLLLALPNNKDFRFYTLASPLHIINNYSQAQLMHQGDISLNMNIHLEI